MSISRAKGLITSNKTVSIRSRLCHQNNAVSQHQWAESMRYIGILRQFTCF